MESGVPEIVNQGINLYCKKIFYHYSVIFNTINSKSKICQMKPGHYIYFSITSILLFAGLSVLGGYPGHHVKFLVVSLVYCALTILIFSKSNPKNTAWILTIILAFPPFVLLLLHLFDFKGTQLGFPSTLAHFLGIGFGLMIFYSKTFLKAILAAILLAFSIWMAWPGYDYWLHKMNFGTFTGKVSYHVDALVDGYDQNDNHITQDDLSGKTVLLDFWHTHCGICFSEFPELQEIYDEYQSNPDVMIIAVNKPLRADTIGQAFRMLAERNYTFPVMIPADTNLSESFGVRVFPTVCIINKEGIVVYRGSIDNAEKAIKEVQ